MKILTEQEIKIKALIQKNKTYKGMLQKQNKVINAMAEEFATKTLMYSDMTPQEIREYFEEEGEERC